jgi:hypothetical protein
VGFFDSIVKFDVESGEIMRWYVRFSTRAPEGS